MQRWASARRPALGFARRGAILAVAAIFLAACGQSPDKTEAAAPPAPVAVQIAAVAGESWPVRYEAIGTVRARTTGIVSSKVMGYVTEVRAHAGDLVREGDLLIAVDARDLDAAVSRAQAMRDEVQRGRAEAGSAIASAKAQLALAEVTHKRMRELFEKRSISNQEMDESAARLESARAAFKMALSRGQQLEARQRQTEQAFREAEIMRGYARIHAPFAGVVTARQVEPGNLAAPGAPLLTIERQGSYRLEVPVEESRLAGIRAGRAVTVSIEALDRTFEARVSEIAPAVDPASRSNLVKIDLPAAPGIRSGLSGRAVFASGERPAIVIPEKAVTERGQLQSVLVAENAIARRRMVTLGERREGRVEVLSGLDPGEKVVLAPAAVEDGARLEVRP